MRRIWIVAAFLAGTAALCQTPDGSLSGLVKGDIPALEVHPAFAVWQKTHASEKRVEPSYELIEYDSQGLWCAGSQASFTLSNGAIVSRLALFYIPSVTAPLPAKVDRTLVNRCELLGFWYQVDHASAPVEFTNAAAQELGASWGTPEVAARFSKLRQGWGWGYWEPFYNFQREKERVVVALDPRGPPQVPPKESPRVMVVARSSQLPTGFPMDVGLGFAPKGQPVLDKNAGGEMAAMARLENPCSFEGKSDWRVGLIALGEQMLRDYPNTQWTPYVHLLLARTYDAKLMLTYPNGDMGASPNRGPLDPVQLRDAAIQHFRIFLSQKPNDPDAEYAAHEAWKLLAGLPPTPIHFGCYD
jgi:hypothetical protein